MRWPDFFIVGAPKCGTTTLYEALRCHPQVFMPVVKEPHFFSPDLPAPPYLSDKASYLALFSPARVDQQIGEASVYYLYSRRAAGLIRQQNPLAKIIIMLRDPVDLVHSLHSQSLYNCDEDLTDLAEALAAETDRHQGRRIPATTRLPHTLLYRAIVDLEPQVKRFLDAFGEDQIHVIFFEDLKDSPASVFAGCLAFLGVDARVPMQATWANPNTTLRSPILERLVKRPTYVRGLVKRAAPGIYSALYRWFHRANAVTRPRVAMEPTLRAQLRREFTPGIQALGLLTHRDLSSWTREEEGIGARVRGAGEDA